jgi:hypothetical protein
MSPSGCSTPDRRVRRSAGACRLPPDELHCWRRGRGVDRGPFTSPLLGGSGRPGRSRVTWPLRGVDEGGPGGLGGLVQTVPTWQSARGPVVRAPFAALGTVGQARRRSTRFRARGPGASWRRRTRLQLLGIPHGRARLVPTELPDLRGTWDERHPGEARRGLSSLRLRFASSALHVPRDGRGEVPSKRRVLLVPTELSERRLARHGRGRIVEGRPRAALPRSRPSLLAARCTCPGLTCREL